MTNTAMITRSAGVSTGHLGILCGSGMNGLTAALDAQVERGAELLRDHFKRNVSIRFNSDRQSGGAWLVTHVKDAIGHNTEIGLRASLYITSVIRKSHEKYPDPNFTFADHMRRDGQDPENPPETYIELSVMINQKLLIDPSRAEHGPDFSRYALHGVETMEEGLAFIVANARDPGPIIQEIQCEPSRSSRSASAFSRPSRPKQRIRS